MKNGSIPGSIRSAACVLPLLLAACMETQPQPVLAGNSASTNAGLVSSSSTMSAPLGSIAADALPQAFSARREVLAAMFTNEIAAGSASAPQLKGDVIETRFDSAALFETASAQLKPAVLAMLSRLAKWQRADGRVVLQITGRDAAPSVDDLAARRAASFADFLVSEGAPASRVRAQADPLALAAVPGLTASVIQLVVVPVVTGSEARAWMPPVESSAQ